jgi:hypothetical protein
MTLSSNDEHTCILATKIFVWEIIEFVAPNLNVTERSHICPCYGQCVTKITLTGYLAPTQHNA